MSALIKKATAILDSPPFLIFFAVWTGIYLVQVAKKEEGAPPVNELWWIIASAAVAVFLV